MHMIRRILICLLILFPSFAAAHLVAADDLPQETPKHLTYLELAIEETRASQNLMLRVIQDLKSKYSETTSSDAISELLAELQAGIRDLNQQKKKASFDTRIEIENRVRALNARIGGLKRIRSAYQKIDNTTNQLIGQLNHLGGMYIRLITQREQVASKHPVDSPERHKILTQVLVLLERATGMYAEAWGMQEQKIARAEARFQAESISAGNTGDGLRQWADQHVHSANLRGSAVGMLNSLTNSARAKIRIMERIAIEDSDGLAKLKLEIESIRETISDHRADITQHYTDAEKLYESAAEAFRNGAKNATSDEEAANQHLKAKSAFAQAADMFRRIHGY